MQILNNNILEKNNDLSIEKVCPVKEHVEKKKNLTDKGSHERELIEMYKYDILKKLENVGFEDFSEIGIREELINDGCYNLLELYDIAVKELEEENRNKNKIYKNNKNNKKMT